MMRFSKLLSPKHLAMGRTPAVTAALFTTQIARPETQVADNLLQIGTRRIFEQEHDMYREMCRRFYAEECTPFTEKWEKDGMTGREVWQKAGAAGMLCVTVPEKYGGAGLDILYSAVNWEEQMYGNSSGPGWALHSEVCAPLYHLT